MLPFYLVFLQMALCPTACDKARSETRRLTSATSPMTVSSRTVTSRVAWVSWLTARRDSPTSGWTVGRLASRDTNGSGGETTASPVDTWRSFSASTPFAISLRCESTATICSARKCASFDWRESSSARRIDSTGHGSLSISTWGICWSSTHGRSLFRCTLDTSPGIFDSSCTLTPGGWWSVKWSSSQVSARMEGHMEIPWMYMDSLW